jgi:hypothetical protein
MTGTKGRAFIYDWNRSRQQRMVEQIREKKRRKEGVRKFLEERRHHD